jgi:hypothetical protein
MTLLEKAATFFAGWSQVTRKSMSTRISKTGLLALLFLPHHISCHKKVIFPLSRHLLDKISMDMNNAGVGDHWARFN